MTDAEWKQRADTELARERTHRVWSLGGRDPAIIDRVMRIWDAAARASLRAGRHPLAACAAADRLAHAYTARIGLRAEYGRV